MSSVGSALSRVVVYLVVSFLVYHQRCEVVAQSADGTYLGCFRDERFDRVLPVLPCGNVTCIYHDLTIGKCIGLCQDGGHALAGVELGEECFCGMAGTNYSRLGRLDEEKCRYPCSGNGSGRCGGNAAIGIYNFTALSLQTTSAPTTTRPVQEPSSSTLISSSHTSLPPTITTTVTVLSLQTTSAPSTTRPVQEPSSSTPISSSSSGTAGTPSPSKPLLGLSIAAWVLFGLVSVYAIVITVIYIKLRRLTAQHQNPPTKKPTFHENIDRSAPKESSYTDLIHERSKKEDHMDHDYETRIDIDPLHKDAGMRKETIEFIDYELPALS